ncbi:MAG TPA: protein kinase [Vicinamibacteria bacterium]
MTSSDIFGDVLDEMGEEQPEAPAAAPPAAAPPAAAAPARRGPIKVQIGEQPGGRKSEISPLQGEELGQDFDALLDAFSDPGEVAADAQSLAPAPAAEPVSDPAPDLEPEAFAAAVAEAAIEIGAEPEHPAALEIVPVPESMPAPVADRMPTREDVRSAPDPERLLHRALARNAPEPPRPARSTNTDEALKDLMNLRAPKRVPDHPEFSVAKFQAATPKPVEPGKGLDLATVVEEALTGSSGRRALPADPAAPVPVRAGGSYGPYRLLAKLAVGGMAEVFKAKRAGVEGFEKVVAVKRILPHLSDNKEFVDMFINEAKMVAGLSHPSIVQIFDLGKIEKSYYIAMEYVHGRDLRSILRRGKEKGLRLPLDLCVWIVAQVCSALEFAHRKKDEQGQAMMIVHRDVSPQNILISFEGNVKLTDFGIAKAASKATHTDAGALRGKLLYMSPEQAWGKPMDRRADLFSLGIVFYEMVTEQKPFLSTSEMSILEMVRECRVRPPTELNARLPEKLEKVLLKALERDPDHRYQDAGEMFRDLERARFERPQPPTQSELARYLELLFDESERSDTLPAEDKEPPREEMHLDFEPARPEPAPARDPMTVDQLLKRFGIK